MTRKDPMAEAFDFMEEVFRHPDRYPDDFVVLPLDDALIHQILSKARVELIRYVREHGPVAGIEVLAHALERDPTAVGRDVRQLASGGILQVERQGRRKLIRATDRPILIR